MNTIENYILGLGGQQKAIVSFFHQHIKHHHDLLPRIKWNIPTYHRRSMICYLNPIKNDGVELAFFRGSQLSNEQGILTSKGRKLVAGIEIFDLESIDTRMVDEIIQEAIILDDHPNVK